MPASAVPADQITAVLTPAVPAASIVPTDVPPAKFGKADGKSAPDQADAGDKQTKKDAAKKDAAAADGAKVPPVLVAAAVPQQPAQVPGPADALKTTDTAKTANPVQAAQTASAPTAAGAAKTPPAATKGASPATTKAAPPATKQAGSADAADAADDQDVLTAQGQPQTDTTAPQKAADQDAPTQTPSQTKASEAGTPVANAVARSRAAPESAVVLPRITRPLGKAAGKTLSEKAAPESTKASEPVENAVESSGIAAPDPNVPPTATGNTHPTASPQQSSGHDAAPQAHHEAADPSSSTTADKTAATGDPGLAGPAGAASAAVAASSTGPTAATQSTNATATATPTAPVPLVGIPLAIAGRALGGERHFDIRLDPPELGRIEVRMKVDRDGRITSHLIADRSDTLDLLRRDGAGLERALQDAGLKTAGDGLQFSLRDQSSNAGQDSRQNSHNHAHLVVQDDVAPVRESLPLSYGRLAGRIGGLDIRV